jgi:probable HAF family extracellular repeat protein
VLALTICSARVHANAIAYTVTDLGTLGGSESNASGQVAGSSQIAGDGGSHAVVWNGTTPTDLGLGSALAINSFGQAAGNGSGGAVRWTGTTSEILGTLGFPLSHVFGINDSGQVSGVSYLSASAYHAARWTGTTPEDLGTLGGTLSQGYTINASGQVAGWAQMANGFAHAVRWTGNTAQDLGTLGGNYSRGQSINASGQVAGESRIIPDSNTSPIHAVLWTGTTAQDLGTLGGANSTAVGINASGQVTGYSYSDGNPTRVPFLYSEGVMYNLFSLLLPGSGVTDLSVSSDGNNINDLGQIAATGTIGGQKHALLLTPTPEPASAVLLLLGGAALLGLRRRG